MIYLRRVIGHSMMPVLNDGRLCVFVFAGKYHVGDIVLANHSGKQFVKRISRVNGQRVDLKGDNVEDSLDLSAVPLGNLVARLVWPRV